jgi:hypothetical protein
METVSGGQMHPAQRKVIPFTNTVPSGQVPSCRYLFSVVSPSIFPLLQGFSIILSNLLLPKLVLLSNLGTQVHFQLKEL